MNIQIHIVDGPIRGEPGAGQADANAHGRAGAVIVFDGVVRRMENGEPLVALEYEHYEPMAAEQLRILASDIVTGHGLLGLQCVHSRGRVAVGECSMRVTVWSAHRKEGLAAMGEFIDRLKRDVPIWKRVVLSKPAG